jgi:hypothetical protein
MNHARDLHPSRWPKRIAIAVFTAIVALAFYGCWHVFGRREHVVATIDAGSGRQIIIQDTQRFGDPVPWFTYDVFIDGKSTGHRTGLRSYGVSDDDWPQLDFATIKYRVLKSSDGNLIAVVPDTHPSIVLVFHDFFTGISWPHQFGKYGGDTMWYARRDFKERLAVLAKEHPILAPAAALDESGTQSTE